MVLESALVSLKDHFFKLMKNIADNGLLFVTQKKYFEVTLEDQ